MKCLAFWLGIILLPPVNPSRALRAEEAAQLRTTSDLLVYAVLHDGTFLSLGNSQDSLVSIPACRCWYVAPDDKGDGSAVAVTIGGPGAGKKPKRIHQGGLRAILDEVRDKQIPGLSLKGCRGIQDSDLEPLAGLTGLKLLHLPNEMAIATFAKLAALEQLEELDLAGTNVIDAARANASDAACAELKPLRSLMRLALPDGASGEAVLAAAADKPHLAELSLGLAAGGPLLAQLAERLPGLAALELRGRNLADGALAELPRFQMLASLTVWSSLVTDRGLANLKGLDALRSLRLGSPHFSREKPLAVTGAGLRHLKDLPALECLQLKKSAVGDADLAPLAGLKLRQLELESPEITDAGLAHLKDMKTLTELNLYGCAKLTDAGIVNLKDLVELQRLAFWNSPLITDAALPHLKGMLRLKTVHHQGTRISPLGWMQLSHIPGLAGKMPKRVAVHWEGEMVVADHNFPLTDASLPLLVASPLEFTAISCYSDRNSLTDAGLACLKDARQLRKIEFNSMQITDAGLRHIAAAPALRTLDLMGLPKITDAGVAALADSPVETLRLSHCAQLTEGCVPHLLRMRSLTSLDLGGLALTDAGVAQLASIPRLTFLGLRATKITDACFEHLKKLPELEELDIDWTPTTSATLARLKELPKLRGLTIGTKLTDADLAPLKDLTQLSRLSIHNAYNITDASLANLSGLVNLRELSLHSCSKLTDAGMEHLKGLVQIEKFGLPPEVSDEGLKHLSGAPIEEFLHEGGTSRCSWEAKARFLKKNRKKVEPPARDLRPIKPPAPPDGEF